MALYRPVRADQTADGMAARAVDPTLPLLFVLRLKLLRSRCVRGMAKGANDG